MIREFDIPEEIKEKLPNHVASGWKGVDPLDAYVSGSLYNLKLTDNEAEDIIHQFIQKKDFHIDKKLIKAFDRDNNKIYDVCPRQAFILGVIYGLKNRGFDVSI